MDIERMWEQLVEYSEKPAAEQRGWYEENREAITEEVFEGWKNQVNIAARDRQNMLPVATLMQQIAAWQNNLTMRALAHWALGYAYNYIGNHKAVREAFTQCEALYTQLADEYSQALIRKDMVFTLGMVGEYTRAIALGEQARRSLEEYEDAAQLANLDAHVGRVYEFQGLYQEALTYYTRSLAYWQNKTTREAEVLQAIFLTDIGVAKTLLGLYDEALEAFNTAREKDFDVARIDMNIAWLRAQQHVSEDEVYAAFAQARESYTAAETNQLDLILLDLDEAEWRLRSAKQCPDNLVQKLQEIRAQCAAADLAYEVAYTDLLLARCAMLQGEYDEAISQFAEIAERARQEGNPEILYQAYYGQGQVQAASEDHAGAITVYERALDVIESTYRQIRGTEMRAGYLQNKLEVYQTLALDYYQSADYEAVWRTVERARARTLVEILQSKAEEIAPYTAEAERLRERLKKLWQELRRRETEQKEQAEETAEYRELEGTVGVLASPEMREIELQMRDIYRELQMQDPRYGALFGGVAAPADISALLPTDTLLLNYVILKDKVYVLPLTAAGMLPSREICAAPTEARVRACLSLLEEPYPELKDVETAQVELSAWWQELIAPLADLLPQYARLIIVPDGALHHLPFHAFYHAETGQYLVETHIISYAPSATAWRLFMENRPEPRDEALVLSYSADGALGNIPSEAGLVAASLGNVTMYTENKVQSAILLQSPEARTADIIHLATHGLFRGDAPLFSALLCADRQFYAYDAYNLRLNAGLVVLGACETAQGRLTGNEHLGLVRGFQYAGARAVLASLWRIHDEATGALMRAFYQHLGLGLSAAEALRAAQVEMVGQQTRWQHPHYWAAFALNGVDGAVGAVGVVEVNNWLVQQAARWAQKLSDYQREVQAPHLTESLSKLAAVWKDPNTARTVRAQWEAARETLKVIRASMPELWEQIAVELEIAPGWANVAPVMNWQIPDTYRDMKIISQLPDVVSKQTEKRLEYNKTVWQVLLESQDNSAQPLDDIFRKHGVKKRKK